MAQGNLKLAKKAKSTTQKKVTPKDMKKGRREIPPKKEALVARAMIQRKNSSSHASTLEKKIATSAISHGKLTIMRNIAETSDEGRKEVLKRK
ncbi:hypothetical protein BCR35DRAFT_305840 [Leucosporidium creatinivorum]|uniref:Uncharacterized protein n=1 Tax=Leucosporidium creatinivorum TaxID=106004 RepID=A0A1Y2EX70_9BASI|nr:hypothetical protein BCR35DRAFT_305840 [Leucosporidium creatinivorum]